LSSEFGLLGCCETDLDQISDHTHTHTVCLVSSIPHTVFVWIVTYLKCTYFTPYLFPVPSLLVSILHEKIEVSLSVNVQSVCVCGATHHSSFIVIIFTALLLFTVSSFMKIKCFGYYFENLPISSVRVSFVYYDFLFVFSLFVLLHTSYIFSCTVCFSRSERGKTKRILIK